MGGNLGPERIAAKGPPDSVFEDGLSWIAVVEADEPSGGTGLHNSGPLARAAGCSLPGVPTLKPECHRRHPAPAESGVPAPPHGESWLCAALNHTGPQLMLLDADGARAPSHQPKSPFLLRTPAELAALGGRRSVFPPLPAAG